MYYLRLIGKFSKASIQNTLAYSANFWISLLHALLNLGTGILGLIACLFFVFMHVQAKDEPSSPVRPVKVEASEVVSS